MNVQQLDEEAIFDLARRIDTPEVRAEYVQQACRDEPGLLARVQARLEVHDHEPEFLEGAPSDLAAGTTPPTSEQPSGIIGDYKLLEQIGEGGMGVVYVAQQQRPVQRRVALKIIKPGMDTKEVIARFDAERQALALMNHPHIAKVLDAGATENGRPFFAMEYVPGIPINEYCDCHQFTTRQRLKLFINTCLAVQHAHQKGIIHRDIKPSNVLVSQCDAEPLPKIIDFGIAKAIDRPLTQKTLYTEYGRMVGTPLYMSPEQTGVGGGDVDTRTDIYALGVVLYELLTGATPFDRKKLESLGYDEIQRMIRDEDPLKPSTKISTLGATATDVSKSRQTDPKRLSALLRRDLDWMVMKALDKDRDRRYQTAESFAMDIERYLNDEPVEAYPPSPAYRFFKFTRRNKKPLLTAAALVAMLVAGTVVSVWQAVRATNSERIAKTEAATSEAVIAFLNKDVLSQANPAKEPNRDLKVRDALDRASLKIADRFQQQPLVEAAIRHALGTAYLTLGESRKGEQHLQRAVEIRRRHLGAEHRQTMVSSVNLAIAVCDQGRFADAEKLHRRILETHRRLLGEEHLQTLQSMTNLATFKRVQGRHSQAEQLCRKMLKIQQRVLRADHPGALESMSVLANTMLNQGHVVQAEGLHLKVYDLRRRVLGSEHLHTLLSLDNLSEAMFQQGKYDQAERLRRRLLEIQVRKLGAEHPATLCVKMYLAAGIMARGDGAEGEKRRQQVFDTRKLLLGGKHPDTPINKPHLSNTIDAQRRYQEAEVLYRDQG